MDDQNDHDHFTENSASTEIGPDNPCIADFVFIINDAVISYSPNIMIWLASAKLGQKSELSPLSRLRSCIWPDEIDTLVRVRLPTNFGQKN